MEVILRGILGRIGAHPKRLSAADRTRLEVRATEMHRRGSLTSEVETALEEAGASREEARRICADGRLQFESEAARDVPLPASAGAALNYYFALGVTPRASTERIHRAFRQRAREVHPDRHARELNVDLWGQLMTIATDAHTVLSDDRTRRAYDVMWLRRSRRATAEAATARERRGDWHTRYHWYMAEIGEIEENLEAILADLKLRLESGRLLDEATSTLDTATDLYEDRILQVRMDALSVPEGHRRLAERARLELGRKDRLISALRGLLEQLPPGEYDAAQRSAALLGLATAAGAKVLVRDGHRRFEVDALREGSPPH